MADLQIQEQLLTKIDVLYISNKYFKHVLQEIIECFSIFIHIFASSLVYKFQTLARESFRGPDWRPSRAGFSPWAGV